MIPSSDGLPPGSDLDWFRQITAGDAHDDVDRGIATLVISGKIASMAAWKFTPIFVIMDMLSLPYNGTSYELIMSSMNMYSTKELVCEPDGHESAVVIHHVDAPFEELQKKIVTRRS